MSSDSYRTQGRRSHRSFRRTTSARRTAVSAAIVTASVLGAIVTASAATAAPLSTAELAGVTTGDARCVKPRTFATEIQWGGSGAPWHADTDLTIAIANRHGIVTHDAIPAGTRVAWSGPNGSASITFFGDATFSGSAQFPAEGPVGYRGTAATPNAQPAASDVDRPMCGDAATFATEIQWGGSEAAWHADTDLTVLVANRRSVVTRTTALVGTQVSWSGPNGSAAITFFGDATFSGSAQFPNEGPVGYRAAGKAVG